MISIFKIIVGLSIITTASVAQDLIIKHDSTKIYCKIIKEDSLTILYKPLRGQATLETLIKKADIIKYYNSETVAKEKKTKDEEAEKVYQAKEKIYKAKELKKGFYRSFREFITNSPSIILDFEAIRRNEVATALTGGGDYTYKLKEGHIEDSEILGFCDGKNVYLNYTEVSGYTILEYIGPFSFFIHRNRAIGVKAMLIKDDIVVLDNQGNITKIKTKNLQKLLDSNCPQLGRKFDAEEYPPEVFKDYLIKLNECVLGKK